MTVIIYILLGLLLIVLQTTVLMPNPTWFASPDLYFIFITYLAYRFDLQRGLIIIFPLSWIHDIFSGVILGAYPATCFSAYFLIRFIAHKMPIRQSLYRIPLVGVIYLLIGRIIHLVLDFLEPDTLVAWSWPKMLARALLIVLFAFPLFRFLESINIILEFMFTKSFRFLRAKPGNRYR